MAKPNGPARAEHTSRTDLDLTEYRREQAKLAAGRLARAEPGQPAGDQQPPQARAGHRRAGRTDRRRGVSAAGRMGLRRLRGPDHPRDPTDRYPAGCCGPTDARAGKASTRSACAPTRRSPTRWSTWSTRDVVFVGHGHFSRSVVTRWVEQPSREGAGTGSVAASVAVCALRVRSAAALGAGSDQPPRAGRRDVTAATVLRAERARRQRRRRRRDPDGISQSRAAPGGAGRTVRRRGGRRACRSTCPSRRAADPPLSVHIPRRAAAVADGALPAVRIAETVPAPDEHRARIRTALARLTDPKVLCRRWFWRARCGWSPTARWTSGPSCAAWSPHDAEATAYLADLSAAGGDYTGTALVGASPELLVARSGRPRDLSAVRRIGAAVGRLRRRRRQRRGAGRIRARTDTNTSWSSTPCEPRWNRCAPSWTSRPSRS